MRRRLTTLLVVSALAAASCSRTVYTNIHPQLPAPSSEPIGVDRSDPQSWRHFFVFGWAPGEMVIDAPNQCGGLEHVEKVETRWSFVQGLIYIVAGYYINIYAPYTGRVVCDHHTRER